MANLSENPKKQEKNEEFPNKFSKIENEFNQQIEREDSTGSTVQNLGAWEKIQKVQSVLSDQLATEKSLDSDSITDMKNTVNFEFLIISRLIGGLTIKDKLIDNNILSVAS